MDCGVETWPTNGFIDAEEGTQFGARIIYDCFTGYRLAGEPERQCLRTGEWDGFAPTCVHNGKQQ